MLAAGAGLGHRGGETVVDQQDRREQLELGQKVSRPSTPAALDIMS
jgi:hypothetical protein